MFVIFNFNTDEGFDKNSSPSLDLTCRHCLYRSVFATTLISTLFYATNTIGILI